VRNGSDKELAKKLNCTLYSVNTICNYYKKILSTLSAVDDDKDNEIMPDFMKETDNARDSLKIRIKELGRLKNCFITSAVDRDYAYNLDINLDLFEGDL
jgi:hypothetical protein